MMQKIVRALVDKELTRVVAGAVATEARLGAALDEISKFAESEQTAANEAYVLR